jgi:hypothetical protein
VRSHSVLFLSWRKPRSPVFSTNVYPTAVGSGSTSKDLTR